MRGRGREGNAGCRATTHHRLRPSAVALLVPILGTCSPTGSSGIQVAAPSRPVGTPSLADRVALQRGPGRQVNVLALSPDGELLAADGDGAELRVWNARSGGFLARLPSRLEHFADLHFSADGRFLLVRGSGLELWDLSRWERLQAVDPPIDHDRAAFSPSGDELLTWGGSSPCASLWRLPDGDDPREFGAEECEEWDAEDVTAADFSPDGSEIVLARESGLERWSTSGFELLERVRHTAGRVWGVAFSGSGDHIVAAAGDDAAIVWSVSEEAAVRRVSLEGMMPRSVEAVHGTGAVLVRGNRGSALLEVASGRTTPITGQRGDVRVQRSRGTLAIRQGDSVRIVDPGEGRVLAAAPILNPNGPWAVSDVGERVGSGWQGAIDVRTTGEAAGEPLHLRDRVSAPQRFDLSPGGSTVATVGRAAGDPVDGSRVDHLYLWDLTTGRPLWRLDGRRYDVYHLDFSPDGRFLATTSFAPGRPVLRDVASGERRVELADTSYSDVRFAPDGDRVLLWGGLPPVLVDPLTGRRLRELAAGAGGPFSPDGRTLAAIGGNVRLWDLEGDTLLREIGPAGEGFRLHGPDIDHAEFHPEGDRILTAGYVLIPTVYDIRSGDTVATYPVPEPTSSDMVGVFGTYSPDGARVLTRIETGIEAWLWDSADPSAQAPEVVFRSDAVMLEAAFSHDDRLLMTTHSDGSTRVWDARTGAELYRRYLVGEDDWVVLTPDGRFEGSPGGMRELRRLRGRDSVPIDPVTDPGRVPGLVEELVGTRP